MMVALRAKYQISFFGENSQEMFMTSGLVRCYGSTHVTGAERILERPKQQDL